MSMVVKRLIREITYLNDEELMAVIDGLIETFEKRKAARLSPPQTPEVIVT